MKILFIALLLLSPFTRAGERPLPSDGNIVNVQKDFGAKGDGKTDDTESIRAAIRSVIGPQSRYNPKFIYFPKGTYLVTECIEARMENEKGWSKGWQSGMILWGESREETVIRLADNSKGFGKDDKNAVIRTGSENPHREDGRGNQAFKHSLINLTVDTGLGNPGAVGIDYAVSNHGTVEFVTIRSGDGSGKVGLQLTRDPGPGLVKHVTIEGFDRGIEASGWLYSMTFEHVSLKNQNVCGVSNAEQVLSFRKLISENKVPVIKTTTDRGLINLVDCEFKGGSSSATAIQNSSKLNILNLQSQGYGKTIESTDGTKTPVPGGKSVTISHYSSHKAYTAFPTADASPLRLPIEETPDYHPTDPTLWANASKFPSLQAAIDSGAEVVYIPNGTVSLDETLVIRGNLRKLMGMEASIRPSDSFKGDSLIRFADGKHPEVIIEHLKMTGNLEHDSSRALAIRHGFLTTVSNTSKASGKLFIEDMIIKASELTAPLHVWARQLNVEGGDLPVLWNNDGGTHWILGYKTENAKPAMKISQGGKTELFGAMFYLQSGNAKPSDPGIMIEDSQASLSFANGSHRYPVQVRETRNGQTKELLDKDLPRRGEAVNCAFFVANPH